MSAAVLIEQIKADLGYLKLARSAEVFAALADAAVSKGQSHLEFLAAVLGEEAAATGQRHLNARLRFADFPARHTIEEFDFSFQPSSDPKLIWDLAELGSVASVLSRPATGATSPPPPTWWRW